MYRYVALSWNPNDPAKVNEARRLTRLLLSSSASWQRVFDGSGLRVFHTTHPNGAFRAYSLHREQGVVLGRLFADKAAEGYVLSDAVFEKFDETESERVVESRGRRLVEGYWGYYVAFIQDSDGIAQYVLRDPTGGLQCHLTESAGVTVILSDIGDCAALGLPPFSVDWGHMAAFFRQFRLVSRTTGFAEVTQLYAGECLSIKDGDAADRTSRSFYWHPVSIYEAGRIENPRKAKSTLRSTIRTCVAAWASSYDSIVHQASGGLDSSIVAACMADESLNTDVLCFNFFTEMAEGDERSYARVIAQSTGFELVECQMRVSDQKLEDLFNRTRVSSPTMLGVLAKPEQVMQRLLTERHAGAVFTGQGGDQLFQQGRSSMIAAEYAHHYGIRPPLFRIAKGISHLTQKSIWSVWATVVRYGLFGRTFDPYSQFELPSLLSDGARGMLRSSEYVHPWVSAAHRLPSSKISQVFDVIDCQRFFGRPCANGEYVLPLVSQPIIERCLQIPTYVHAHRGKSRGLVREAFERNVPAKIIQRESKGGTTSYLARLFLGDIAYLRELLLDGVLVREGMLDRRELENALSERELVRVGLLRPILCAVMAETWLSTWRGDVRQQQAA